MHFVALGSWGGHGMGLMMWRRGKVEYLVRLQAGKVKGGRSTFDLWVLKKNGGSILSEVGWELVGWSYKVGDGLGVVLVLG